LKRVREVYLQWRRVGFNHHKALSATAKTCAIRCRDARPLVADIRAEIKAAYVRPVAPDERPTAHHTE